MYDRRSPRIAIDVDAVRSVTVSTLTTQVHDDDSERHGGQFNSSEPGLDAVIVPLTICKYACGDRNPVRSQGRVGVDLEMRTLSAFDRLREVSPSDSLTHSKPVRVHGCSPSTVFGFLATGWPTIARNRTEVRQIHWRCGEIRLREYHWVWTSEHELGASGSSKSAVGLFCPIARFMNHPMS